MKNADLHSHSHYSDGEFSPKELVRLAKKKGIKHLALTDHNSVKGIPEAISEGKKLRIEIIPAVEVVAREDEILGYYIDYKNKGLQKELKVCSSADNEKVILRVKALEEKGIDVSCNKFIKKFSKAFGNYNGGHLIFYLISLGYLPEEVPLILGSVKNKKSKKKNISLVAAIKIVLKYGGVPVLAHPWLNKDVLKEKNIKKYVHAGLKGIEIENGDINKFGRDRQTVKRIKQIAKRYDLIITSGSDFHGDTINLFGGKHYLGEYNCDEKVVEKIKGIAGANRDGI